jgi:hypothetical protein
MAGERSRLPSRMSTRHQAALSRPATRLTAMPCHGASIIVGWRHALHAAIRIEKAAARMSDPSTTAARYSAL